MQHYEAIENGIASRDIKKLREAIGSLCYTSRDFSSGEFDEAIRYVEGHGIKIKENYNGEPLISQEKTMYSDEDFANAVFELKNNFCNERIEDVKRIGKILYKKKTKKQQESEKQIETTVKLSSQNGTSPNLQSHQVTLRVFKVAVIVIVIVLLTICCGIIRR